MIRKAKYNDVESIQNLIRIFSETGKVLFRSLDEIKENISNFWVYEKNDQLIGVCSLKKDWGRLVELRSLGVDPRYSGQGIGTKMVEASLKEALSTDCDTLFVLTYAVSMFKRLGFRTIDKERLPHKVWNDCNACLHQENCDETAMVLSLVSLRQTKAIQIPPTATTTVI
ncbi:MAG TPA: N-acetyltransferase [Nitrospinaceae bacterium]|jgi:amino-acid N-acetyltransferase|nr:N-acetyltransferase [Nitrospinaceae bacterium]HIB44205.1 N-acetyltransferase [Nitrospina sp.]HIN88535.1 N-acetyltransferase [Nitrospinaceae bacterium]|tara:strand:+ start:328 stop:837 length:510 start_codon:yes stop_codon:yes gene_type:complete